MKKFIYISIILFFIGCKSTKKTADNQLDISKVKIESIENNIKVKQIALDQFEITFHTADPKKPVTFTDQKGNTHKFENVKKATLKKKSEQKKDSTVKENRTVQKKETDKSKIKETEESISDAKNYKGIFAYIAFITLCFTILFLIFRFKLKSKKDITF